LTSRYPFAVIKEKLHARRGEVTDFAMGSRRLNLPEELMQWLNANPELALKAAPPDAVNDFKDAAASLLSGIYGLSVGHEQIVPIPGGRVAMTAVAACVLQPDDSVLVTEPGYPAFARLASHWHANVCPVPLDPERGFAPDLSGLSTDQLQSIRIFSLNYPNNPSGGVLDEEARRSIINTASRANALVFNDNVYGPLTYESQPASLLSEKSDVEVIELHALTKLYPLGPQGASFLTGSSETMKKIATYSEFAWSPMSAMQIQATTWCLRDEDGRSRIKAAFHEQLKNLRQTLLEIGFEPYAVPAGIYVLCKLPRSIAGTAVATAEEAAIILLDKFDLAVVPWEQGENHYLRFTSMYSAQDLQRLKNLGDDLLN
jgi:aspartate/methionine/tyrosine aminotransferase